jgi:hypothetical protein
VSVVSRLDDAPPSLVLALTELVGEIVPAGAPFDATDVVWRDARDVLRPVKHRRLIFIWNRSTRWVVATERGGFAYGNPVFAFEVGQHDHKAILVREEGAVPTTVCSKASSLLDIDYTPHIPPAPPKDGTRLSAPRER